LTARDIEKAFITNLLPGKTGLITMAKLSRKDWLYISTDTGKKNSVELLRGFSSPVNRKGEQPIKMVFPCLLSGGRLSAWYQENNDTG
jgi:hypothetical protein